MQGTFDALRKLGQGQRARLTLADDTELEVRANQSVFEPGERVRLELTSDTPGERTRYSVDAWVDGGQWTALQVRRYDPGHQGWQAMGELRTVTPLEMFRTVRSSDMEAQADTGTGG